MSSKVIEFAPKTRRPGGFDQADLISTAVCVGATMIGATELGELEKACGGQLNRVSLRDIEVLRDFTFHNTRGFQVTSVRPIFGPEISLVQVRAVSWRGSDDCSIDYEVEFHRKQNGFQIGAVRAFESELEFSSV